MFYLIILFSHTMYFIFYILDIILGILIFIFLDSIFVALTIKERFIKLFFQLISY